MDGELPAAHAPLTGRGWHDIPRVSVLLVDGEGVVAGVVGAELTLFERPLHALLHESVLTWARPVPGAVERIRGALAGERSALSLLGGDREIELLFEPAHGGDGCVVTVIERARPDGPQGLRLWRFIFDQVPGAVWATDRELRVTHAVGRVTELADARRADLLGRTIGELVGDGQDHPILACHRAALEGKPATFTYEQAGHRFEIHLEPLVDETGARAGVVGIAVDTTARRRTERALERSRALLAEAHALAHIGTWEWDVRADRFTCSVELQSIYGCAASHHGHEPLTGFLQRFHPEDRSHAHATILDAARTGGAFSFDARIIRDDGETRMVQTRGSAVGDHDKARLVASCWDVTERWRTTEELRRSLSLLQATLEATTDGILVVGNDGRVTALNRRFVELWHLPEQLVAARDDEALLAYIGDQLEDEVSFRGRVRELYDQPHASSTELVALKEGRFLERHSRPQYLGDRPVGRVWSFRDVTERERLLARATLLADASRVLASLEVERALGPVARLSLPLLGDGCTVDLVDESGPRRVVAVERNGSHPLTSRPPTPIPPRQPLLDTIGGRAALLVPLVVRDGPIGTLAFGAGPGRRYDEDDLEVAEELGHRIVVAIENASLYKQARDALRTRDEFLSVAAHELRGPITSIHLAAQTLLRADLDDVRRARATAVIQREDRRLARFVDELLDVTRIRAGRFHLELEEVDLVPLTREVVARLSPEVARYGGTISVESPVSLRGRWDEVRLDQLLWNLLTNAAKFGRGRPIEVRIVDRQDAVELSVTDHGIGIAADARERIFHPFERGVSARHYGGLGLGLYIVRMIAEGHGGEVRVDSTPGAGSTFTVRLPRRLL